MRIDKYICKSTEFNRTEARALLQNRRVCVDGKVFTNESTQVHESNCVTLNGEVLVLRPYRYLMLHKPQNTLCSMVDEAYPSILNGVSIEKKSELHIVGRLDADTTGLVFITDDGRWSYNIITPNRSCEKVYRVYLRNTLSEDAVNRLEQGVLLQGLDAPTLPAKLELITPKEVLLTITEGKFHQVKRMFRAVGNRVLALHREKIGKVSLDLDLGAWRYLTDDEVAFFEL